MAKYKPYSYAQGQFIPVFFDKQIQQGTFEYTLSYLIDSELELSIFDDRFHNDETGAPAYDPRILLKIILFTYSRGITSSRKIARYCEELPSNASKEWSGTRADFRKKVEKMETAIERMVARHCAQDTSQVSPEEEVKEVQYIEKLQKNAAKIKEWLAQNDDRKGSSGKPIKSNITDNESAKMKTSKGVIQGYVGVASVDEKNQVIVNVEAFGQGQEHNLLIPTIEGIRHNFESIGNARDIFQQTKLTADSGYHSEKNMEMVFGEKIDAYVADPNFRKRDPRFVSAERYKEQERKLSGKGPSKKLFTTADFSFPEDFSYCICPAGQRLYRSGYNVMVKNFKAIKFKGAKSSCLPCRLRNRCLRKPDKTEIRQVAYFTGRSAIGEQRFTEKMKQKIDSATGRAIYSMRLAVGEPPFAHIRSILGLDRFTLRGKLKVNTQWNLFCIVHNLKKIHGYGQGFA
ncbi:MAG: transposase [Desulforhopalus sp.]